MAGQGGLGGGRGEDSLAGLMRGGGGHGDGLGGPGSRAVMRVTVAVPSGLAVATARARTPPVLPPVLPGIPILPGLSPASALSRLVPVPLRIQARLPQL